MTDDWFYLVREYHMSGVQDPSVIDSFLRDAFMPAAIRLGLGPIGVFTPWFGRQSFVGRTVIVAGPDLAVLADLDRHLELDPAYQRSAAPFLDAPATQPPFDRMSSSLLRAMPGLAHLHRPAAYADVPGRLIELRRYEQPTYASHRRKVEMFTEGEGQLLDESGLHGIMYATDIVGDQLPRFTYVWMYANLAEREAAEARFFSAPSTAEFFGRPRYANTATTMSNDILRPTDYSQI